MKTIVKMVNDIAGVRRDEQEWLRSIFDEVDSVKSVVLYGSRAKGTHRDGSDIDLTLKGGHITTQQLLDICLLIDDLLLPYEVDLSIFTHIDNKSLVDHIDRVGKVIFMR